MRKANGRVIEFQTRLRAASAISRYTFHPSAAAENRRTGWLANSAAMEQLAGDGAERGLELKQRLGVHGLCGHQEGIG